MKFIFQDAIIYEDDHFMVVNKPPYMATLEDRNSPHNLQAFAKRHNETLSACHRLDKETSGAVLFAKSEEAYRHASMQFEHRKIVKVYHAFVDGLHDFKNEKVDLPILPLKKGIAVIDYRKGKESSTTFSTLETFKRHTLIECKPLSGRMHQIRVHLAKKKAPIINDELYGGKMLFLSSLKRNYKLKGETEEQPLIKRFALHARKLTFENFSEQVTVDADYPKDIAVLYKQLQKNS
jgi:RluA family pseudouridine synthase